MENYMNYKKLNESSEKKYINDLCENKKITRHIHVSGLKHVLDLM